MEGAIDSLGNGDAGGGGVPAFVGLNDSEGSIDGIKEGFDESVGEMDERRDRWSTRGPGGPFT